MEATSADKTRVRGADPFENIRELDENERWTDRNWVITAPQHQENLKLVSQTLGDIIEKLPIGERWVRIGGEISKWDFIVEDLCVLDLWS